MVIIHNLFQKAKIEDNKCEKASILQETTIFNYSTIIFEVPKSHMLTKFSRLANMNCTAKQQNPKTILLFVVGVFESSAWFRGRGVCKARWQHISKSGIPANLAVIIIIIITFFGTIFNPKKIIANIFKLLVKCIFTRNANEEFNVQYNATTGL